MNIWIEKTKIKGRNDRLYGERALGKAIWSPKAGKDGRDTYSNMRKVQQGDFILHLIDNSHFSGVSTVKSKLKVVPGLDNTQWYDECYLFYLEGYEEFKLDRKDILNDLYKTELIRISNKNEVFYQKNLQLRQGAYLTPCHLDLLNLIAKIYLKTTKNNIPKIYSTGLIKPIGYTDNIWLQSFKENLSKSGLNFGTRSILSFVAALLTKPFLILTGLSGSGKTKLAQSFAGWICKDESQYLIVPVGADWTNREPLLGYPNALNPNEYVKPESGALQLIIQANEKPELPHFLILDEMNLSHVERYFADFLSVMESKEEIHLYDGDAIENGVPSKLKVPSNLFIIGTVNIDETTNMFSPKVLDRANTIEFRVTKIEMENFLSNVKDINLDNLNGKGAGMAKSFLEMAANKHFVTEDIEKIHETLVEFFGELKKIGAEFGYRTATEILRLINQLSVLDYNITTNQKIDIAIIQKLLPKLHGSRRKLCPVLETLGKFCITGNVSIVKDVFDNSDFDFNNPNVLYSLSLEKISRMYRGAIDNGFTSFAEA